MNILDLFRSQPATPENLAPKNPVLLLRDRYIELCAYRDATYAKTAELQSRLNTTNAEVEDARNRATALANEIQAIRGPDWLALKAEIGLLAKALSGRK